MEISASHRPSVGVSVGREGTATMASGGCVCSLRLEKERAPKREIADVQVVSMKRNFLSTSLTVQLRVHINLMMFENKLRGRICQFA